MIALEWNTSMLVDVLERFQSEDGGNQSIAFRMALKDQVKRHFPTAIYHDTFEARYGRPAPELSDCRQSASDQPTAEALGYAEVLALKQMDRMEIYGGFATHETIHPLQSVGGYWSAVLDRLMPDVLSDADCSPCCL